MNTSMQGCGRIYWHRELPPVRAEFMADLVVEADSVRVTGGFVHADDTWGRCHADLMDKAEARLMQEISRLGGDCAHVHGESITPKHDDTTGESWLHGRFTYALFRRPTTTA